MGSKVRQQRNWPPLIFIVGYHVGLIIGLPFYFVYHPPGLALILISVALLVLTEIGIGAAYHRFYAHRCYTMNRFAESVLLFFANLATQGSAFRWSYDHRMHHRFSDTKGDPYSVKQGFWHAHMLWLFKKPEPIDTKRVPDLMQNPLVMFQHKYAGRLAIGSNILLSVLIGWLIGDFLGAFVLAWWTRLAVSHHLTWFVNSLCHTWGSRTYSKELTAVDNYVLAVLTVGEGYHNYHHTFPSDYRNGVRWYHVDPTKWTIWTLSKLGLAGDLKRISAARIERRLLQEDHRLLVDRLEDHVLAKRAELKHRIEQLAARIQEKLGRRGALIEQIKTLKRAREATRAYRQELRAIRQSLREDWRAWHQLCCTVLEPQLA